MMKRPILNKDISIEDFKDFYWLKTELVDFCRSVGISTSGSKLALTEKIICYLQKGIISKNTIIENKITPSEFNWNKDNLTLNTVITAHYKNTKNVRAFFKKEIGKHFTFNVAFMAWMKNNIGKTLAQAIEAWQNIKSSKKDKNYKTQIGVQFQYNQYMRDFLADNPQLTARAAMHFWKLKTQQRGLPKYAPSDIFLKEDK